MSHLMREAYFVVSALLLIIVVVLIIGQDIEGKTITVDDDGGADYEKIQDAIDAADNGDTVQVNEGVYFENIVVDKSIDLIGSGRETTTINASGNGSAVLITVDYVNLTGFSTIGSGDEWSDSGIWMQSNHSHIYQNNCSKNRRGIYQLYGNNSIIEDNICEDNDRNILLIDANRNVVRRNTCSRGVQAINLYESDNNLIKDNICSGAESSGIVVVESKWNTVAGNTASENGYAGINLASYSKYNNVSNNNCSSNDDNGILIHDGVGNNITQNNCSFNGLRGIYLDGGGTGWNLVSMNDCHENAHGIELYGQSFYTTGPHNNTISNNRCSKNSNGILMSGCINNEISANLVWDNFWGGISGLGDCHYLSVIRNVCLDNGRGIYFGSSIGNFLKRNDCTNNSIGIDLYESSYANLTGNTCSFNTGSGIEIEESENNYLTANTISDNRRGIRVVDSTGNNSAHYNNIYGNLYYGIGASENNGYEFNATLNWWGHLSGPYHESNNSNGEGDNVTDFVLFDPWIEELMNWLPIAYIDSISPNPAIEGQNVSLNGHATDYTPIETYVWRSSLDGEICNDTLSVFETSELSVGTHTIYFKVQDSEGSWSEEVTIALGILLDSDDDGVPDIDDAFPNDNTEWNDTDEDGVGDNAEVFPNDETEWEDTDSDGVGDNADAFPNDQTEWEDTDSDGTGDNADAFPTDPAASKDTDGDTYPDEWNAGKTAADSTTGLKLDAYPDNPDKWKKESSDSPGFGIVILCAALVAVVLFRKRSS